MILGCRSRSGHGHGWTSVSGNRVRRRNSSIRARGNSTKSSRAILGSDADLAGEVLVGISGDFTGDRPHGGDGVDKAVKDEPVAGDSFMMFLCCVTSFENISLTMMQVLGNFTLNK